MVNTSEDHGLASTQIDLEIANAFQGRIPF